MDDGNTTQHHDDEMPELRRRALALLQGDYGVDEAATNADLPQLLQELRIAQVELQLQNEELRNSQAQLETAHRKYFDYYELAPVGYLTLDDKGLILDANLTARDLLRQDDRHVVGKPFSIYLMEAERPNFYAHLMDVLSGQQGQLEAVELAVSTADAPLFVRLESKPHDLGDGRRGLVIVATDITKRHQLEVQLRHKQNRLEDAQKQAKLGYWWRDFDSGAGEWSAELYRLLGYEPYSVPSDHEFFMARVHPDDVQPLRQAVRDARYDGVPINFETRFNVPYADEPRILHIRLFHHEDEATSPHVLRGIMQDVTELRQAQEEALRAEMERARMEVLTHFISDASHEFRTPLTILQSSIELAHRRGDMDFFQQRHSLMIRQIDRIERILDTMLLTSKLSMMHEIGMKAVALGALLSDVGDALRNKAAAYNKTLDMHIPAELSPVRGDENLLFDALYEVIYNAVRHSGDGGRVAVAVNVMDDRLRVVVADDGEGVPPALRERVFEAFYRVDEAHTSHGVGLGLTIAKQIVDLHDGAIWIEDSPSGGATVCICLPVMASSG